MSDTVASLRRKIDSAEDLESVVRTMKTMAASSVGQYEDAVRSLDDYYRTVQLGLAACLRQGEPFGAPMRVEPNTIDAVVFGSDQGLVGQFNEVLVDFVASALESLPGRKAVWAVGERVQARLADAGLTLEKSFILPNSIGAITPLVGEILIEMEAYRPTGEIGQVYLFHNHPEAGAIFAPMRQRLLPLDHAWWRDLARIPWPTENLPEVINGPQWTLPAFVREYLFVSLYKACAESLASENAARLAAMHRAEKNIDELLDALNGKFHRLRQSSIDEELFDLVAGFEVLKGS